VLYAGVSIDGVYKTKDGGQTWQPVNNGIKAFGDKGPSKVLMDPIDHNHLFYSGGSELYESADGGETWKHLGGRSVGSCPGDFADILFDPANGTLYTAVFNTDRLDYECDTGVYRSKDGGKNWDLILETPWFTELYMNPDHGEKIYAFTGWRLYGSSDSGETWEEYCTDCRPIGVDENGEIFIHSSGKYLRSTNGTSQWKTFLQPLHYTEPGLEFIVINPHEADSWYFGSNYLRIAHNGGESISDIRSGLGASAFNIYIDKKDNAVIYSRGRNSQNVYRSLDGGTSMENHFTFLQSENFELGFFLNNENTGGITIIRGAGDSLQIW